MGRDYRTIGVPNVMPTNATTHNTNVCLVQSSRTLRAAATAVTHYQHIIMIEMLGLQSCRRCISRYSFSKTTLWPI